MFDILLGYDIYYYRRISMIGLTDDLFYMLLFISVPFATFQHGLHQLIPQHMHTMTMGCVRSMMGSLHTNNTLCMARLFFAGYLPMKTGK